MKFSKSHIRGLSMILIIIIPLGTRALSARELAYSGAEGFGRFTTGVCNGSLKIYNLQTLKT